MDDRGGSFVAVRRISQQDLNRGHSTSSGILRELILFIRNLAPLSLYACIISSFSSTCLSGVKYRSVRIRGLKIRSY